MKTSICRGLRSVGPWCAVAVCLMISSGCSLGVMFNKMLLGDPLAPAEFRAMTDVDLTKGKERILVMCTTPPSVSEELTTLSVDIAEGISRTLKREEVNVVSSKEVSAWIDDHGGVDLTPEELAQDFKTDFIAWIDIKQFSTREPNSPDLLRGRCSGFVRVYRVREREDGTRYASTVYSREFGSTFPIHQPISATGRSPLLFQKEFVDQVSEELSERFYDHRPGIRF